MIHRLRRPLLSFLRPVAMSALLPAAAARSGFETSVAIAPASDVAAQALDFSGRVLATTRTVKVA